jgi:hypothetical protein
MGVEPSTLVIGPSASGANRSRPAAVKRFAVSRTFPVSPWESIGVSASPLFSVVNGAQLAHQMRPKSCLLRQQRDSSVFSGCERGPSSRSRGAGCEVADGDTQSHAQPCGPNADRRSDLTVDGTAMDCCYRPSSDRSVFRGWIAQRRAGSSRASWYACPAHRLTPPASPSSRIGATEGERVST